MAKQIFPHHQYMSENNIQREAITQDYLADLLDKFAAANLHYEEVSNSDEFASEEEKTTELTRIGNQLSQLSNEIYEDLKAEFPANDGYLDVDDIIWPHKARIEKYNVKTIDLPKETQTLIKNFNSKFNYIKETDFASPKEQEQEVDAAKEASKAIDHQIKTYLASQTTAAVAGVREQKESQKRTRLMEEQVKKLVDEIKGLVTDKHEFGTTVLVKVDELKQLPGTDDQVKELMTFIETTKAAYFKKLREDMTPEEYLDKIVAEGKLSINDNELKECKVAIPKRNLLPSTSGGNPTSFQVGKYTLTQVDFSKLWKIAKTKVAPAAAETKPAPAKKEEAEAAEAE